jgi:transcriptional regulator with XRE-family HTH domain
MSTPRQYQKREKTKPQAFLREWRIHQGMTLQEVGDKIGVHRSQISNWETGGRMLNEEKMISFCDAIGIKPAQVYQLPDFESIDALLADATPEQRSKAIMLVKVLLERD